MLILDIITRILYLILFIICVKTIIDDIKSGAIKELFEKEEDEKNDIK